MKYLKFNKIKKRDYTKEELELINECLIHEPNINFKQCKKCMKYYPLNSMFFLREKRVKDGYENSCRVCRSGKFQEKYINDREIIEKQNIKFVSNPNNIIEYYEEFLNSPLTHSPMKTFIKDNYKTIIKYLIEVKYKMKDEEIFLITRDWIKSHKLYGLSIQDFRGSTYDLINDVYPNKFQPWEFITSGNKYWDNEDNIKKALHWFMDKLFEDNVIKELDDIPIKVDGSLFKEYKLGGLLSICFKGQPFTAIDYIYPNMFYEWEYITTIKDYWNERKNRIKAIRQLVDRLGIDIKDIPKVFSHQYFDLSSKYYKFKKTLDDYYNFNIYSWINEAYPNMFKEDEFSYKNHYRTLDSIIVKSEPERIIHHIFLSSNIDFEYCDTHKNKFYDTEKEVGYIPDWIIYHNDKILIVEYYGMLNMNNDFDVGYNDKYDNKHEYYISLCKRNDKYIYIDLYSKDIFRDRSGLVDRLKDVGIDLMLTDITRA